MAILGLCAAASAAPDDKRRYYLAKHAALTWHNHRHIDPAEPLTGHATGTYVANRTAEAAIQLTADGTPLATAHVSYSVLTTAVFARAFATLHQPGTAAGTENPYTQALPLTDITSDPDGVTATVIATPADCAGHFDDYPTVPAAVLGTAMINAASRLVDELTGTIGTRWIPDSATLDAHRLMPAGTPIAVAAQPQRAATPGHHAVTVVATADEKPVAELALHLRRPEPR